MNHNETGDSDAQSSQMKNDDSDQNQSMATVTIETMAHYTQLPCTTVIPDMPKSLPESGSMCSLTSKKNSLSCCHCQLSFDSNNEANKHNTLLHPNVAAQHLCGINNGKHGAFCTKCNILFPSRDHLERIQCVETDRLTLDGPSPKTALKRTSKDSEKSVVFGNEGVISTKNIVLEKRRRGRPSKNSVNPKPPSSSSATVNKKKQSHSLQISQPHDILLDKSLKIVLKKYIPPDLSNFYACSGTTNEELITTKCADVAASTNTVSRDMCLPPTRKRSCENSCKFCCQKFASSTDLKEHEVTTHGVKTSKQQKQTKAGRIQKNSFKVAKAESSLCKVKPVTESKNNFDSCCTFSQPNLKTADVINIEEVSALQNDPAVATRQEFPQDKLENENHTNENLFYHSKTLHPHQQDILTVATCRPTETSTAGDSQLISSAGSVEKHSDHQDLGTVATCVDSVIHEPGDIQTVKMAGSIENYADQQGLDTTPPCIPSVICQTGDIHCENTSSTLGNHEELVLVNGKKTQHFSQTVDEEEIAKAENATGHGSDIQAGIYHI